MNIYGTYNYWKQGALCAAGVRRVSAEAGPQRAAYRGGGILYGLAQSLFLYLLFVSFYDFDFAKKIIWTIFHLCIRQRQRVSHVEQV